MLRRVAEVGWAATTVADVVADARVSRNAFYELFADREDCFLAAAEEVGSEMLAALYGEAGAPTWIEALDRGLTLYLRSWQERPAFARAYLVELPGAGARAQEQRDRSYGQFARMFEALAARAREEQPGLPPLDPFAPRVLVTAITELIAQEIRANRIGHLGRLHAPLKSLIIKLLTS
jgi:AcrR family transcriptional regulator